MDEFGFAPIGPALEEEALPLENRCVELGRTHNYLAWPTALRATQETKPWRFRVYRRSKLAGRQWGLGHSNRNLSIIPLNTLMHSLNLNLGRKEHPGALSRILQR
jgi:hypothetical protein